MKSLLFTTLSLTLLIVNPVTPNALFDLKGMDATRDTNNIPLHIYSLQQSTNLINWDEVIKFHATATNAILFTPIYPAEMAFFRLEQVQ